MRVIAPSWRKAIHVSTPWPALHIEGARYDVETTIGADHKISMNLRVDTKDVEIWMSISHWGFHRV